MDPMGIVPARVETPYTWIRSVWVEGRINGDRINGLDNLLI